MTADVVIQDARSRLGALLEPIAGGVGADVSYDEIFENLKNEVDKLQSLAGLKPDWGAVASTADEILTDKSKDFRVAVYYAAAKSQLDGLPGLLDGLLLIRELSNAFWEPMYPSLKRPKARGNLMGWYSDLAAPPLEAYRPTSGDGAVATALDEVSRAIDDELRQRLGEAYPGMGALRSSIRNLLQNVPKDAPPAAAPPPPAPRPQAQAPAAQTAAPTYADVPAATSGGGPGLASIVDAGSAASAVSQCALLLARAGDTLRAADPTDPAAYRISRTGFWLEVAASPPAEGGATLVPPPPGGYRERFDALIAAENWLGVLAAADEIASEYILWLDPHRFAANAMDRLGATFSNAKKALLREVGVLLLRVPSLPSLAFNDGTPFADGQTKMWIDAEVKTAVGSGSDSAGGASAGGAMDGPTQEARALAASGKLDEAVAVVTKAAATAPSQSERFRGRLALAKLCLDAEQFAVARAQLEGLDKVAEQYRLAEWEPALCADLYAALYRAHRGLNRGEEVPADARQREAAAFDKLCQLDAAAALKLSSG